MWDRVRDILFAEAPQLFVGLLVLLVGLLLARVAGRGMALWVQRQVPGGGRRRPSQVPVRVVRWSLTVLSAILALQVVGLTGLATSLLATGGLLAIVLGFAFKEIGENLLAGLLLSFSRSFDVGDLIESGGFTGIVREIRFREVHIRTGDGRDIFIPSASIFRNALQNFTRDGLRQGSFVVGVDYGDDPDAARRAVEVAMEGVGGVLGQPAPRAFIHELAGNWVELRGTFWIDTFEGGISLPVVRSAVLSKVHQALTQNGFTFSSNVSSAHTVDITKS